MGQYAGPRSFNFVTLLLLVGLAAAGYGGYRFVPIYVRDARIKSLMGEGLNKFWKFRGDAGYVRLREEQELRDHLTRQIRDLGVDDEDLEVTLFGDKSKLRISADYTVVVEHPYIKRYTVLRFHPSVETDATAPW